MTASFDTSPGTLVWSSNPLANRAMFIGDLAYVAITHAQVQQAIYDGLCERPLPDSEPARGRARERREAAYRRYNKAELKAQWLLRAWGRLSSALEARSPELAEAVETAIWDRAGQLATTKEGHPGHA